MDANQHVNNTKYLSYTETARIQYLQTILSQRYDPGMTNVIPLVKETVVKYKLPVTYPDTGILLSVGVKVDPKSIKSDRMDFVCLIVSHKHNVVACEVRTLTVMFDIREHRKKNIPPEFLRGMEEWEQRVDPGLTLVVQENLKAYL
ncbi:hypothetical protein BCR33DRAFT_718352 [Rhizoclosmatium globosum]|uniref:Thioesterase/thiol ester dehydrase-isomerase n=1 Tax=Rhizoclosmatium globosum TaxID=329046 RepID=A0A1Y2C527_9FUNG|nr:hypothetical protein BCR33DRAFT_718352 [Rhizoclosmatium globosum]|eukprot:ORY42150.1 hypothetical protein BCR33DRAFT_718352 [Rhizoclosmatium globosum]